MLCLLQAMLQMLCCDLHSFRLEKNFLVKYGGSHLTLKLFGPLFSYVNAKAWLAGENCVRLTFARNELNIVRGGIADSTLIHQDV